MKKFNTVIISVILTVIVFVLSTVTSVAYASDNASTFSPVNTVVQDENIRNLTSAVIAGEATISELVQIKYSMTHQDFSSVPVSDENTNFLRNWYGCDGVTVEMGRNHCINSNAFVKYNLPEADSFTIEFSEGLLYQMPNNVNVVLTHYIENGRYIIYEDSALYGEYGHYHLAMITDRNSITRYEIKGNELNVSDENSRILQNFSNDTNIVRSWSEVLDNGSISIVMDSMTYLYHISFDKLTATEDIPSTAKLIKIITLGQRDSSYAIWENGTHYMISKIS